jgi:lysyl-tRNA synthetase, class II
MNDKINEVKPTSNQERQDRLNKLNGLINDGINPYPSKTKKKTTIDVVQKKFDSLLASKKRLVLAGRIMSKREHGNLTFASIFDSTGHIQIALSKQEIGEVLYKRFLKYLDVGDFIEISGYCFVTHKEENSIMVLNWRILTKALRPLPDKWHGLKDEEEKFRKRYLDLLLNKETREIFIKKSLFWDVTRNFMKKHGFFEVETPTLETTTGGAEANPFKTKHKDFNIDVYLRISVGELWQKRLMAAGFEKTFEIGKVFRNEGSSPDHLQEFTNMEFYWAYANYKDGMKLVQKLYREIANKVFNTTKFESKGMMFDFADEWPTIDYKSEVLRQTGVDIEKASKEDMEKKLDQLGVKYEGNNLERLTDSLWKYCRKNIAGPAFLINHPKIVSPLAKSLEKNSALTERFQIIIAGSEIGNGYSELNNPIDQQQRFEIQKKLIEAGDEEAMMPDYEFVEMLEYGMPPTCGFGFGERLFSALVSRPIRETTLFPLLRPKQELVKATPASLVATNKTPDLGISYEKAQELINNNISDNHTKLHLIETEAVMRSLANHFKEDEEKWGIIGLLHDIDWDKTKNDTLNHTIIAGSILQEAGATKFLIDAIQSHCYGHDKCGQHKDKARQSNLEHSLIAAETVTGLIVASALMQPDKKLSSVKLSSLIKKYKNKSFAANCSRDNISEIEKTGLSLEKFLEISLVSLQKISDKLGL